MARQSPLIDRLAEFEPTLLGYGTGELAVPVIESFGELEFEYASLRRSGALLDQPHRGTIEARGSDAIGFLNRMLTQKLADLKPGSSTCSFWLNRQGRIVADLRLLLLDDRLLLDVDVHAAGGGRRRVARLLSLQRRRRTSRRDGPLASHRNARPGHAEAASDGLRLGSAGGGRVR